MLAAAGYTVEPTASYQCRRCDGQRLGQAGLANIKNIKLAQRMAPRTPRRTCGGGLHLEEIDAGHDDRGVLRGTIGYSAGYSGGTPLGVLCGGGLHLKEIDARHDDLHRLRDRRVGPAPRPDGVLNRYSAVYSRGRASAKYSRVLTGTRRALAAASVRHASEAGGRTARSHGTQGVLGRTRPREWGRR